MIVIGIDPGPTKSAWAVMECTPIDRPRWVAKGHVQNSDLDLDVLCAAYSPQLLAVETSGDSALFGKTPQAMRNRARQLALTNRFTGKLLGEGKHLPCAAVEVPANISRRSIGGKANCSDATIKESLALLTVNMPAQTNSHTRDAAAAAIVGWRMVGAVHSPDEAAEMLRR